MLATGNSVQWYCTMRAFKYNSSFPDSHNFADISSVCAIENIYYFQRAVTLDRNKIFQFCFKILKGERKSFHVVNFHFS